MMYSFERSGKGCEGGTERILPREMFLSLLDFEVKRSRRYQNFFCILVLKLNQISNHDNGIQQRSCYQKMAHLLEEELRESDIVGILSDNSIAAILPYGDPVSGENAKARFDRNLKYFDFPKDGYEIIVDRICFPTDSTNTSDLIKRLMC